MNSLDLESLDLLVENVECVSEEALVLFLYLLLFVS